MPLWVVVVAYSIPPILVGSPVWVTERRASQREERKKEKGQNP
jgi:hypothetical protein